MCVGIPLRVVRTEGAFAVCEGREGEVHIDTMLVGDVGPGVWLLTFLGAAREVLDETRAAQINRALAGLAAALEGEAGFEDFFDDLIDSEPRLPPHLQAQLEKKVDA